MAITLRNTKGSALSFAELDGNFTDLQSRINGLPDSAQVAVIVAQNAIDSADAILLINANSLDSAEAQAMIDSNLGTQTINDSATVQAMIDSNLGLQSINDSATVQGMIDSSLGLQNINDSSQVQAIIDSNFGAIDTDLIPALDSIYDLGSTTNKWKDLHLSGSTIHLGGQTIKNEGGKFQFSQELSTGENNISVTEGNGFFVNLYANVASADSQAFAYGAQANSLKLEGNTIQFATVDGIVAAEMVANEGIMSIGDSINGGGALIVPNATIAQRNATAGRPKFKKGAIVYQTDSNSFEFYDSDGWQKFIKLDTLKTEVAASADFAAFKTRIAAL